MQELNNNPWKRLTDATHSMDSTQRSFVMSQEAVKNAYAEMLTNFTSYLFEKFKEDFAAVPAYRPLVDRYVNTVIDSAQDYGKYTMSLEDENKKLKQQLEELQNANRHQTI